MGYIMPPPRFQKKGKGKKKIVDPFEKKNWYNIKAPRFFPNTNAGVTPVNRTSGNNIASDNLEGRVVTINLADLQKNEKYGYANIKLKVDEVQGKQCLTNFYGLTYTTDKLKSLVKKWQTLIEANVDVKTKDGYQVRLFCIGFTKPRPNQVSKFFYAQSSKVKQIRERMVAVMSKEASSVELKESSRSWFTIPWANPSAARSKVSTLCVISVSARSSSSRLLDMTPLSFWNCTVRARERRARK